MKKITFAELLEAVERDIERQEAEKAPEPVNTQPVEKVKENPEFV